MGGTSPLLDLTTAADAIRSVNADVTFLAAERLMHQHFQSVGHALDPNRVAERLVLLDGLWSTQLFRERGAASRIVRNLEANANRMIDRVCGLPANALQENPEQVVQAARELLPIILDAPGDHGKHKQFYSFASKFLHWTSRKHFPIMDSLARVAISRLQRLHGFQNRIASEMGDLDKLDDYQRWIEFYSGLIRSLTSEQREHLLTIDRESQRPSYRCQNTLLRVLDKVFYMLGS